MNILYITFGLNVPPRSGMELNRLILLEYLSKQYNCTVLTLQLKNDCRDTNMLKKHLHNYGIDNVTIVNTSRSFSMQLMYSFLLSNFIFVNRYLMLDVFLKNINDKVHYSEYAIIHIEGFALLPYAKIISHSKLVFSSIDAMSLRQKRLGVFEGNIFKKLYFAIKEKFTLYLERTFFSKVSLVHIHSSDDSKYLKEMHPNASFFVNPVMVPNKFIESKIVNNFNKKNNLKLLFLGNLMIKHISEGLYELLDSFDGDFTKYHMELIVVGRSSEDYASTIDTSLTKGVRFLSWVDDYLKTIQDSDVVVLPDKMGTGIKNRTLQSMALGKLVIGTKAAFQDIPIINNHDGIIVSDINSFRDSLMYFEKNRDSIAYIGSNAKDFVVKNNSQKFVCGNWDRIYKRLLQGL